MAVPARGRGAGRYCAHRPTFRWPVSAFVVYPERGVAVVVLTNLVGANPQQFIPRIADFYARDASTPSHERVAPARQ